MNKVLVIESDDASEPLIDALRAAGFAMFQECLTNVWKHPNATQVGVRIEATDTAVETMVKDNGKCFDVRGVASDAVGKSMGLLNIRERSELLGGSPLVQSSPGRGSEIILFFPTTGV